MIYIKVLETVVFMFCSAIAIFLKNVKQSDSMICEELTTMSNPTPTLEWAIHSLIMGQISRHKRRTEIQREISKRINMRENLSCTSTIKVQYYPVPFYKKYAFGVVSVEPQVCLDMQWKSIQNA